ncbi:MAG: hypothetical protein RLZZ385_2789 [Pseudomonadota bacterium]|jgi:hypothetical protein
MRENAGMSSIAVGMSRAAMFLGALFLVTFSHNGLAQSPSVELKSSRDFIYQTGADGLQPFIITVTNPRDTQLLGASFDISMPATVRIGAVDGECAESVSAGSRYLSCRIFRIDPRSTRVLDFYVDGPLSAGTGPQFSMVLTSPNLTVIEPSSFEASLADGDRSIRGSALTLKLIRDIGHDGNQNGMPDLDEQIIKPQPGDTVQELLAREAVIDILFLYTPAAQRFLGDKLPHRIQQLITATNQRFLESEIPIVFRAVGEIAVNYNVETALTNVLDAMQAGIDPAFGSIQSDVVSHGADMVVLMHGLQTGTDTFCGYASLQGIGRQGDFDPEYYRGQLMSVVDVGPSCTDLGDMAPLLAANMGVVPDRIDTPDGGTFSFSAGYGVSNVFATLATRLGAQDYGSAVLVDRFSNPDVLCQNLPCGVSEADIAAGANAVESLSRTRHVISALSENVLPVTTADRTARITPTESNGYDLEISQTTVETAALQGAFAEYQVRVTNPAAVTVHDLAITLVHLNGGVVNLDPQTYRMDISDSTCRILGNDLHDAGLVTGQVVQKSGRLYCFVQTLGPGESLDLKYQLQIDDSPPSIDGQNYYHEIVAVNGNLQAESAVCLPVFANLVLASQGSTVCQVVNDLLFSTALGSGFLDLNALPTVTGNLLTIPFLRLFDGSLYSVDLRIINFGQLELEVQSVRALNSNLVPAMESTYDASDVLAIIGLDVGMTSYNLQAQLVPGSDPPRFGALQFTEIIAGP